MAARVFAGLKFTLAFTLYFSLSSHALATWHLTETANFKIYSNTSEKEAKRAIEDLERYRSAAFMILGLPEKPEPQPLDIFLLSKGSFKKLTPSQNNILGLFTNLMSGPTFVMQATGSAKKRDLVFFHEYVHHLTQNFSPYSYPFWYTEGIADVLGNAKVTDTHIKIGMDHPARSTGDNARWQKPMSYFIGNHSYPNQRLFLEAYRVGWAMTHYITLGPLDGHPDFTKNMAAYLTAYNRGQKGVEAFEKAFEMPVEDFDSLVRKYVNKSYLLGLSLPSAPFTGKITQTNLSDNAATAKIIQLASYLGKREYTAKLYKKRDKDESLEEAIISVLYATQLAHEDLKTAKSIAQSALTTSKNHPEVQLHANYIQYLQLKNGRENKNWDQKAYQELTSNLEQLRSHFPQRIEDENTLLQLYSIGGDLDKAIQITLQALAVRPKYAHLHLVLGKLYMHTGELELAKQSLTSAQTLFHNPKATADISEK